jgi:hypothetical protein
MPRGDVVWPMVNSICHGNVWVGTQWGWKDYEERDCLIGEEGVVAIVVHFFSEMLDNGLGLHMQVSDHGVAVPAAKYLDEVHVNFSA